jgi:TPR repeat protein
MIIKAMRRLSVALIGRLLFALVLAAPVDPAISETIQVQPQGGTYVVAVRINETIILPFVIDTGSADVSIPTDVFLTLLRSGTVKRSDFVGTGTYILADGSNQSSERFILHEVRVGDHVVRNVVANVAPVKGDPLLGQSFLSKLPSWTIDYQRNLLVFNDGPASLGREQRAALPPPKIAPFTPEPMPAPASAGELVERGRKAQAEKNYTEAMRWYRMAADQGNATGQNNIGAFYDHGWGVTQNFAEAMRWYGMAASQGNGLAEYNIGNLYMSARGVARDYVEALRWFQMPAAQGYNWAQYNIGMIYSRGGGVPRDDVEALRWFRMAAAQGNTTAQNNIGVSYEYGWGVSQDYGEAMRWYRMAAGQGLALAQSNVGEMIARGEGVAKDCTVARRWFETAAASGEEWARQNLRTGVDGSCQWGSNSASFVVLPPHDQAECAARQARAGERLRWGIAAPPGESNDDARLRCEPGGR